MWLSSIEIKFRNKKTKLPASLWHSFSKYFLKVFLKVVLIKFIIQGKVKVEKLSLLEKLKTKRKKKTASIITL